MRDRDSLESTGKQVMIFLGLFFIFSGVYIGIGKGLSLLQAIVMTTIEFGMLFGAPYLVIQYTKAHFNYKLLPEILGALISVTSFVLLYFLSPYPVFLNKTKSLPDAIKPLLMGWGFIIFTELGFEFRSGRNNNKNLK